MSFKYAGRSLEFDYLQGRKVRSGCRCAVVTIKGRDVQEVDRACVLFLEGMRTRGHRSWSGFGEDYPSAFQTSYWLEVIDPTHADRVRVDYREVKGLVTEALRCR